MRIYKVIVSKGEKEYLSVAPLIQSKAKDKAAKLHEQFPHGVVTVLSTENPNEGWNECWVVNPSNLEVEVYREEDED
jgi:hypothetical protein